MSAIKTTSSSCSARLAVFGLLALGALGPSAAHADPLTWNWSFSDNQVSGSGTFTTDSESGGSYLITGISGTWEGLSITDLLAPGTFLNDNLLYPGSPQLDGDGVSFEISGGDSVNIFFLSSDAYFVIDATDSYDNDAHVADETDQNFSAELAVTPVPEPATLSLFGAALAGLGLVRRRRGERR